MQHHVNRNAATRCFSSGVVTGQAYGGTQLECCCRNSYREKDQDAKPLYPLAEQGVGIARSGRGLASDASLVPAEVPLCKLRDEVHRSICSSKQGVKQARFVTGSFGEAGNTWKCKRILERPYYWGLLLVEIEDNFCSEKYIVLQDRG